jgi:beta-lactamase class A
VKQSYRPGFLSRRALLVALATVPLAGCAAQPQSRTNTPKPLAPSASKVARPSPTAVPSTITRNQEFSALEQQFNARLGIWAVDTGSGVTLAYRSDERFAFCSTGKAVLAAAILRDRTPSQMEEVVHYLSSDLIAHSPVTTENLSTGMTLTQLCDAAVRHSDNAAANALYAKLGGPTVLQTFVRSLGDSTTQMQRIEPDLSFAVPGDERDTTTPQAWGSDFRELLLGRTLTQKESSILENWMVGNTTGSTLIRQAIPVGWKVADKTGSGWYGTRNNIAIVWPPGRAPWVLAVMSSKSAQAASINDKLVAQAAVTITDALT